jgi:hypothetical protein
MFTELLHNLFENKLDLLTSLIEFRPRGKRQGKAKLCMAKLVWSK